MVRLIIGLLVPVLQYWSWPSQCLWKGSLVGDKNIHWHHPRSYIVDRHMSSHPFHDEPNTHSTVWTWSDNLFITFLVSVCLVIIVIAPSIDQWVRQGEGMGVRWRTGSRWDRRESKRERERERQHVLSGLALWADVDYSLHSSLPSQATTAIAKALYFSCSTAWSWLPFMSVWPLTTRTKFVRQTRFSHQ